MSNMGKTVRKGWKRRRVLGFSLVLALLLVFTSVFTALGASYQAEVVVLNGSKSQNGRSMNGWVESSSSETINLNRDKVFEADRSKPFGSVRKAVITSNDLRPSSATKLDVEKDKKDDTITWYSNDREGAYISYTTKSSMSPTDFNGFMKKINLSYDPSQNADTEPVHLTLRLYYSYWGFMYQFDSPYQEYTVEVRFSDYATGSLEADSLKVTYHSDDATGSVVDPADSTGGVATFNAKMDDFGSAKFVDYGYQLRKAGEAFTGESEIVPQGTVKLTKTTGTGKNQKEVSLTDEEKAELLKEKLPIKVTGFNAGEEYVARAVFMTNGNDLTPKYSQEISLRYDKPLISSFNVGNTEKNYRGGEDSMSLSMLATFNNQNYDATETTLEGNTFTGPLLRTQVFFTENFNQKPDSEGVIRDSSTWAEIESLRFESYLRNSEGEIARSIQKDWSAYTLPDGIDSQKCAYKLVVTDVLGGYSTVKYSNNFTVDSSAPTQPSVIAHVKEKNASGQFVDVEKENPQPAQALTVGGANGTVKLDISKSTDAGSLVKDYSYSMYYLSTSDITDTNKTVAQVLGDMASYEADSHGQATYTSWTSLTTTTPDPEKPGIKTAELAVSKDGYYRIDVQATDNAGHASTARSIYFRVDLTAPNTPETYLAAQTASNTFGPYDNRTYTTSTVWMFMKSQPMVGKSIEEYEYSTDSGLTWKKVSAVAAAHKKANGSVTVYEKNQYNKTFSFGYDYGINLTGLGMDDYTSVIVRATDNLNNTSMTSDPAIMRTVGETPKAQSVLRHEGIEVALALGNSTMETSNLTPDLKNKAAEKINQQYYGKLTATSSNVPGNANFNPLALVATQNASTKAWTFHECSWTGASEESCAGPCSEGVNCPYAKAIAQGYEFFTPEMVNVQGMAGANANDQSLFSWVRYDHTMYPQYATTLYTGSSPNKNSITVPKPTNLKGNENYKSKTGLYTASQERTVFMGQDQPNTTTTKNTILTTGSGNTPYSYNDLYNASYASSTTYGADPNRVPDGDDLKHTYAWREGIMPRRIYHMMDISYPETVSGNNYTYDITAENKAPLSKIANAGYPNGSFRDWLFLYNDQPTKKTIYFTIDDGKLVAHSNDGYGFLFNTTIRQSKAGVKGADGSTSDGSWRISGYLFYIGNMYVNELISNGRVNPRWITGGFCEDLSGYEWFIIKVDDVNLEHFSDGTMRGAAGQGTAGYGKKNAKLGNKNSDANGYMDDLSKFLITNVSANKKAATGGVDYGLELLAHRVPYEISESNKNTYVRNYVLQTEGDKTKIYEFTSGKSNDRAAKTDNDLTTNKTVTGSYYTVDQVKEKFAKNVTKKTPKGASVNTAGYKLVEWTTLDSSAQNPKDKNDKGTLITPRPTVDGVQIGLKAAKDAGYHKDSNCYGFGPLSSARSWSHWCFGDTRIQISNISMTMTVARKLSEVVTEPQWGGGKAKYIANISDDSVEDFQDPVLSAQIQWRLFTDSAKFIGWGGYDNGDVTKQFIDRIEGDGTYEYTETKTYGERDLDLQVDEVATYITQQYYKEFGYDMKILRDANGYITGIQGDPVIDQVSDKVAGKGNVYSLKDAGNIDFSVTPAKYNTTTANPDFPAGRWYIVHDINGYEGGNVVQSPRNEKYSDALDIKITDPGRYSIYFAPSAEDVKNGTLDPQNAVFDFIVNQAPVARFTGYIENNKITIDNASYDPDTGLRDPNTGAVRKPMGTDYNYLMNGAKKSFNSIQISGLVKEEWRWELLAKRYDDYDEEYKLITIASSAVKNAATGGWYDPVADSSQVAINGATLKNLTNGNVTEDGKKYYSNATYFETLPDDAVLTVYQRVTDTTVHREAVKTNGQVTGYRYVAKDGTVSGVNQQNLTSEKKNVTYAPLSSFALSSVNMYDTADENGSTGSITVSRQSMQTQKRSDYNVSWAVDLSDGYGYRHLVRDLSTDDFYMYPKGSYPVPAVGEKKTAEELQNEQIPASVSDKSKLPANSVLVMDSDPNKRPSVDSSGNASGDWAIKKAFLKTLGTGNKLVLRITESIEGFANSSATKPTTITDESARAIYYKKDVTPPTAQSVLTNTYIYSGSSVPPPAFGGKDWNKTNYEASNYLDVTADDKYIEITVGGSADAEGKVAGYGYYFYDKTSATNSTEKGWWKMDPATSKLTSATSAANALVKLPASGGTIRISKASMRNLPAQPTDSLNIAIFAFDNQTGTSGSLTGGNETARTRIEDIRLSTSLPIAPEIEVKNALGNIVTSISNKFGYLGTDEKCHWNDKNVKGEDEPTVEAAKAFSNSNVTVQFKPKQDKFKLENGAYVKDASGTDMYEDVYKKADLTNTAQIVYSVEKQNKAGSWEYYYDSGLGKELKNVTISPAELVTLSANETYRVTAQVMNGAKAYSESRSVQFTVDKTPPTAPSVSLFDDGRVTTYSENTWASKVTMTVSGSVENENPDTAYYEYSIDNGASWVNLGNGLIPKTAEFKETKEYTVRIRAADKAGNTSEDDPSQPKIERIIKIDTQAPNVSAPTLTATSKMESLYQEYIISTSIPGGGGSVYALVDGEYSNLGTEFAVPYGEGTQFRIVPDEGYQVRSVTYDNQLVTDQLVKDGDTGASLLQIEKVEKDAVLVVQFGQDIPETYMYTSRLASRSAMKSLQSMMAAKAAGEAEEGADPVEPGPGATESSNTESSSTESSNTEPSGTESSSAESSGTESSSAESSGTESSGTESGGTGPDITEPEEPEPLPDWSVTTNAGPHGSISDGKAVVDGEVYTCTITPNKGYTIDQFNMNGNPYFDNLQYDAATNTYSCTIEVHSDVHFYVLFKEIPKHTMKVTSTGLGSVTVQGAGVAKEINSTTYEVYEGRAVDFEMQPNTKYMVDSMTINGEEVVSKQMDYPVKYSYMVPENGTEEPIEVVIKFDVGTSMPFVTITPSVFPDGNGECHGTIEPSEMVNVVTGGSYTFKITPEPNYHVDYAEKVYYDAADDKSVSTPIDLVDLKNGSYQFTFTEVTTKENQINVSFAKDICKVKITEGSGGVVRNNVEELKDPAATGKVYNVPVGTEVVLQMVSYDGYRIKNVLSGGVPLGALKEYRFTAMGETMEITTEFVERKIGDTKTTHSIEVVANNISDTHDQLAPKPYRFRMMETGQTLADSEGWSDWQAENTITYTGLDPNKQYTVEVEARDVVGNRSKSANSTYTLANRPATIEAVVKDEVNNDVNKSVALVVDPNGNPKGTEYLVYYSTYPSMQQSETANAKDANKGWATLNSNNEFTIKGLDAGIRYYLQVVARNHDGKATAVNDKDIASVLLSPTAPPANTFWFEEQSEPGAGITLNWTPVPEGIRGVEIYRDGTFVNYVSKEDSSYTDMANIPGDTVCVYSYAYENDAGTGSKRTAVSEEFYKAKQADDTNTEAKEKLKKMEDLITSTQSADLFGETLTYPVFPDFFDVTRRSPTGSASNTGRIEGYVKYTDTIAATRPQQYVVGLHAYEKDPNTGAYSEVDKSNWDPLAPENLVRTTAATRSGAFAVWSGLNVNYEYKMFVHEVCTTGPQKKDNTGKVIDGYEGSLLGIEGSLGKRYIVDESGYRSEFTDPRAAETGLETVNVPWSEEESLAYTNNVGWDQDIDMDYIKFNKSPHIGLPTEKKAIYEGNVIQTDPDTGEMYILLDQSGDKKFSINVTAWDPDGAPSGKETTVKGIVGGTVQGSAEGEVVLVDNIDDSLISDNFVQIVFDGKWLPTGVYDSIELTVSDGETQDTKTLSGADGIKLVVNQAVPNFYIAGNSDTKKIQAGKTYETSVLNLKTMLSANTTVEKLREVRLMVLADRYNGYFGSHVKDVIVQKLRDGDAAALASAKELLGQAEYDKYQVGSGLSEAGALAAIDAVSPGYKAYVQITAEQYQKAVTDHADAFAEELSGTTLYWAEANYAMDQKICTWFERAEGGGYKVKEETLGNKYPLRLISTFGNNSSAITMYFECTDAPSMAIESKKSWAWVDTVVEEYDQYRTRKWTIGDVYEIYKDSYAERPTEDFSKLAFELNGYEDGWSEEMPGSESHRKYRVFKLVDERIDVGKNYVSGKVQVVTGIYDRFESGNVIFSTDRDYTPTKEDLDASNPKVIVADLESKGASLKTGIYNFEARGLIPDSTYYMWTAYKFKNPEASAEDDQEAEVVFNQEYVAVTTDPNYIVSNYSFTKASATYYENEAEPEGTTVRVGISRMGDNDKTMATMKVTAKYYAADEFGNIQYVTDAEGNQTPVEIADPETLSMAKESFGFQDEKESVFVPFHTGSESETYLAFPMTLKNNEKQQGHMVVRLFLSVDTSSEMLGYNNIASHGSTMDIFVQDAQSPVTSFKLGLVNEPDENGNKLGEVWNGDHTEIKNYTFQYAGVQTGYPFSEEKTFTYRNAGTGTLTNIKAAIYENERDKSQISEKFGVVGTVTSTLESPETDEVASLMRGTVTVVPQPGLDDGEHTAWLCLSADNVKEKDEIWIRFTFVVGQSTLRGRIYFTPDAPVNDSEITGVSTVYLYRRGAAPGPDGTFVGNLDYVTQTDEKGWYEIPNILNKYSYYIVVERDGFILYDGVTYNYSPLELNGSQIYEFNLRLISGDIDGDRYVTMDDYNTFVKYFNKYYDMKKAPETEEDKILRSCDLNYDGIVNALDRVMLWGNMDKSSNSYKYRTMDKPVLIGENK